MRKLEITIFVNPHKRVEFNQTLEDLALKLQKHCTSLKINESKDDWSFSILALWETAVNMNETLNSDEFKVLSGAIEALCEKIEIRLNDEIVGNRISMLNSKRVKTDKMNNII